MADSLITVIIPAFNAEVYIADAIQSILNQSYSHFELIIVDDCSTDSTWDIIQQYKDSRIIPVQHKLNRGVAAARNTGISIAKGKYIAFLDADDYAYPERLKVQFSFLEKNPEIGIIGSGVLVINNETQKQNELFIPIKSPQLFRSLLLFNNCFATSTVTFRNSPSLVLMDTSFVPAEDYRFWVENAVTFGQGYNVPQILVKYRSHENSLSQTNKDKIISYRDEIITQQLSSLGIFPSTQDLNLHHALAHAKYQCSHDFLSQTTRWLEKLARANERVKNYNSAAFKSYLADIWLKVCSHNLSLGWELSKVMIGSELRKYSPPLRYMRIVLLSLRAIVRL